MSATFPARWVPEPSRRERDLLASLAGRGLDIASGILTGGASGAQAPTLPDLLGTKARVCRRWVFEALMLLDAEPRGFNAMGRALGGLRGEALAVKTAALEEDGLARRSTLSERPLRVRYDLSPRGREVAHAVLSLVGGHMVVERHVLGGPSVELVRRSYAPVAKDFGTALDSYARDASRFRALLWGEAGDAPADAELARARRFAELCVRRWRIEVCMALMSTSLSFSELRRHTGAGSESLSIALDDLTRMGAVERHHRAYALATNGWLLSGLGAMVVVLAWRAHRERAATS